MHHGYMHHRFMYLRPISRWSLRELNTATAERMRRGQKELEEQQKKQVQNNSSNQGHFCNNKNQSFWETLSYILPSQAKSEREKEVTRATSQRHRDKKALLKKEQNK